MWPFRRPSDPPPAPLEERLEQLEDRYRRLERRFERMQGEFSALYRYDDDDDDASEFERLREEKQHASQR